MRRHFVVSGRVQGVGFRQYAAQKARALKLSGWVKNLPDGNVECEAQGGEDQMLAFEKHLHAGPSLGRVDALKVEIFPESTDLPMIFEIRS